MTSNDPAAIFRKMLDEWEKMANRLGGGVAKSDEFARFMHGVTAAQTNTQEAVSATMTRAARVAAWLSAIEADEIDSLVAEDDGAIVATAALVRDPLSWSAHVGEVRLLVAPGRRGSGLGSDLLQGIFIIARERGLAKLIARMTVDQAGSIALFEGVGFRAEAMLKDQVRGADGQSHDLAILSYDAARVAARHAASGIEQGSN